MFSINLIGYKLREGKLWCMFIENGMLVLKCVMFLFCCCRFCILIVGPIKSEEQRIGNKRVSEAIHFVMVGGPKVCFYTSV